MKTKTIEELAYFLKEAKDNNTPAPIFFLGAGASKTGGIPLAGEIIDDILRDHCDNPSIKALKKEEQTYAELMECLSPSARNKLLKGYIDQAKINVSHIYLAQFIMHGFADYVLTVNFDNLMLRALALFNEFPSTYDMAILKDMTTTSFKKRSVVYLHGQHHGLWLLNTQEEMAKVKEVIPPILNQITNERPWIFIGYSGDDPIFEHIEKLGRFDNGLYWVGYKDHEPNKKVKDLLEKPNTNAFLIKDYDADSFMLKLNSALGLPQPEIVNKPFTSLKNSLNEIVDIDDEDHFKGVKERLEIARSNVGKAIQQFEQEESEEDELHKKIISLLVNGDYPEDEIKQIERDAQKINTPQINDSLADLYYNWGIVSADLAETKSGDETESLFQQACNKNQKATELKADYYWAYINWGNALGRLAKIKLGDEAESFFQLAINKYQKATDIKADYHGAYYNWGSSLVDLAKTKSVDEAEPLFQQAFEKLERGVALGGKVYNLACLYILTNNKEKALQYLEDSLKNKEITANFVKEDDDWSDYYDDNAFTDLLRKYV